MPAAQADLSTNQQPHSDQSTMNTSNLCSNRQRLTSRRQVLQATSCGFGWLAFSSLATRSALADAEIPSGIHFPAKAKRVIFLDACAVDRRTSTPSITNLPWPKSTVSPPPSGEPMDDLALEVLRNTDRAVAGSRSCFRKSLSMSISYA